MLEFPKAKQDLLIALVSQLNDYLLLLSDNDGKIIGWHKPTEDSLGFDASEVVGRRIEEIITGDGVSDSDHTPEVNWVRSKDSHNILMSGITLAITDAADKPFASAHILRNVSSHRSAEINSRALVAALQHSSVLVRRWDGAIEHWTEGCERLYGYTSAEAIGVPVHKLLETEYPKPIDELQQDLLVDGVWRGEVKQRRKDGSTMFVSIQLVKLEPHGGEQPLIVSTHSDITSRLEMQLELESANSRLKMMTDELARSNEELEEFARIASHDLSAPITSTRWLVELLASRHGSQLDPEGQKALAQVATSLERMSDLVEAVLTHAKVGKSPIATFEESDTALAIEVALENLRRDVITSGAQITYGELPPLLIGQQALTQLFQNLLSNAIKYRRTNVMPRIEIGAERSGALWRIYVRDNGMGIEPEWFERIFLPMQRRHSSKIAGSGIGLATCRKIVNRAGGRIWVDAQVGVGSTFFFTLPGESRV